MSHKAKPHPKNVEGDFYVEDGCCTACMTPESYAPSLMGFDESTVHCFVAKQPTDKNELYQAIKMTWAAELECIRYGGENLQILRRLAEAGVAHSCDQKHLIQDIKPLLRNHTTFEYPQILTALELAAQFKEYLSSLSNEYLNYKVSKITRAKSGVFFSFSWYENNYYTVWFNRIKSPDCWHVYHSPDYEKAGSRAISLMVDEWLRSNKHVVNIKWYANIAWSKSFEWQETPF